MTQRERAATRRAVRAWAGAGVVLAIDPERVTPPRDPTRGTPRAVRRARVQKTRDPRTETPRTSAEKQQDRLENERRQAVVS